MIRALLLAAVLAASCATFGTVATGVCDPVVSEVQTIARLFAPPTWQADVDRYIADGHALCKVQAAVDQFLGGQALASAAAPSPEVVHMRAWRAVHP